MGNFRGFTAEARRAQKLMGAGTPGTSEVPVFQENHTSAAVDGARIACVTARVLVEMDGTLSEPQRDMLSIALLQARRILDVARFTALPAENATSVHIVRPNEPTIIVPGQ